MMKIHIANGKAQRFETVLAILGRKTEIAVTYGERTLKFRVLDVREHAAKADAASMYEIIND